MSQLFVSGSVIAPLCIQQLCQQLLGPPLVPQNGEEMSSDAVKSFLHPSSDGLQFTSNGLQPTTGTMTFHLRAMASTLVAMASNLLAMASNLLLVQ